MNNRLARRPFVVSPYQGNMPMITAARLRTPLIQRVSWLSRESWLHVVRAWLLSPIGVATRKHWVVSENAVLAVAADDAANADHSTGANVRTSNARVGRRIGYSGKVVQRARQVLERGALARTVETGRYLTNREREQTGQRKMASRRWLYVPRHLTVHLPRSVGPRVKSYVPEVKTRRAQSARQPRSIELQRLAGQLVRRLPFLSREGHIGRVCSALESAGIDPQRWEAADLHAAIDAWHAERGHAALGLAAHSPDGWLRWAAAHVAAAPGPTPTERRRAEAAERAERRRRHEAEAAEMRAYKPSGMGARLAAQMRADLDARRRREMYAGRV